MSQNLESIAALLPNCDLGELYQARHLLERLINERKEEAKATFNQRYQSLLTEAEQIGISLKPETPPAVPKYRNPANPEQTWTGRGKKPGWMSDALAAGATLESLLIESVAETILNRI